MTSSVVTVLGELEAESASDPPAWPEEKLPSTPPQQSGRRLQPNLTRRSHKKSRTGCFSCKTRKIKCGEERPACNNCVIKSNTCVYPSFEHHKDYGALRRSRDISPVLSPTGENFSMQDMQFFHHFLTVAYPHLPHGNDAVWIRHVPQIAQRHCYLMNAILGLGASHQNRSTSARGSYDISALSHRTLAMSGLNSVLAKDNLGCGEADAILATCYILTFQSVYLSDGMSDFFTLIRGCSLVATRISTTHLETAFDLTLDRQFSNTVSDRERLPALGPLHILGGLNGLNKMQPYLCSATERTFSRALYGVLVALQSSIPEAYRRLMRLYAAWSALPQDELDRVLDSSNTMAQLLFAYFIAIEMIMVPITKLEWPERFGETPFQALLSVASWVKDIVQKIPPAYQQHVKWPNSVIVIAEAEIMGLPFTGPAVLFVEGRERLIRYCGETWSTETETRPQTPS